MKNFPIPGGEKNYILDRAAMHENVNCLSSCDTQFYMGGYNYCDFIALALGTSQSIYLLKHGMCEVVVFKPSCDPCKNVEIFEILLSDARPSSADLIFEFVNNNHFDSCPSYKELKCSAPGCSYKTTDSSNLTRHEQEHQQQKFKCAEARKKCNAPGCTYASDDSSHLKRHEKTHQQQKFKCAESDCDFQTAAKKDLKKHIKETHARKKCNAPGCTYASDDSCNLKRHEKTHERVMPLPVDMMLANLNSNRGHRPIGCLKPISEEVKQRIQAEIELFKEEQIKRWNACACCDELCRPTTSHNVDLDEHWQERLEFRLRWMTGIPEAVRTSYDISKVDSRLKNLSNVALSPRGVIIGDTVQQSRLRLCDACFLSLSKTKQRSPPKFAIANGWEIGDTPKCFSDATWAEIRMITLAPITGVIKIIGRGGTRRKLHSHTMALINAAGPAATYFPQDLEKQDFQVVFSNASDQDIEHSKKKLVRVRKAKIDELASDVKRNNIAYANAKRLDSFIATLKDDTTLDHLCEIDNQNLIQEVISDTNRVNSGFDESDSCVVETSGGLFNLDPVAPIDEDEADMPESSTPIDPELRRFKVTNSSTFLPGRDPIYYGAAFPDLFPFGRGTPNSKRPVPVSLEAGLRHLLLLSSRRFAQHKVFSLAAFDELARRRCHRNLVVKLKSRPTAAQEAIRLSPSAVKKLLRHNDKVTQAARTGRAIPELEHIPELQHAKNVLNILNQSSGKTFGTNEERLAMRRRVYAYYHKFGRPHLMITASPRDDNSFWIAVHAGFDANTPESTAKNFEDLWQHPQKVFPGQDDIQRAALKDPVLAAVHFDEFSKFFFEKIVGWDKSKGQAAAGGGLFGKAVAYTAGVETQGGGTLHMHALIFLEDFPASTKEEQLWVKAGQDFSHQYCTYADSLASAIYPIYHLFLSKKEPSVSNSGECTFHCPVCSSGYLESLPVPFFLKTNLVKFPRPMAKCTVCHRAFTAGALRSECTKFLANIAGLDLKGLKNKVESLLSGSDLKNGFLIPKSLDDESRKQLSVVLATAFKNLPVSPPSASVTCDSSSEACCDCDFETHITNDQIENAPSGISQISTSLQEYIWANIVLTQAIFVSQEHSFKHHGSCFSRGKKRGCKQLICRYDNPKAERLMQTALEYTSSLDPSETIENELCLRRVVGCEYLTPYNEQLFSIIRSNHDIAFLRGRSIIYSVKYTVKPQETVDSTAIVERLITGFDRAFRRREELETENPNWTDTQRGSGRLHSLLYQLTGVQEVANTMASFYVYRNEMAFYESHPKATLILASALAKARQEDDEIVISPYPQADGSYSGMTAYQDYLWRPLKLDKLSWFEYQQGIELINIKKQKTNKRQKTSTATFIDDMCSASDDDSDSSDTDTSKDCDANGLYHLHPNHPKVDTMMASVRSNPAVVEILGPGLAPKYRQQNDIDKDNFSMYSLLMFVPHRSVNELKENAKAEGYRWGENEDEDDLALYQPNQAGDLVIVKVVQGVSTKGYVTIYNPETAHTLEVSSDSLIPLDTWTMAFTVAKQRGIICSSGLTFIDFNNDRWEAMAEAQIRSQKYYDRMKRLAETDPELADADIPAYVWNGDEESESDAEFPNEDIIDSDETHLDFADQGDEARAPGPLVEVDPRDVLIPPTGQPISIYASDFAKFQEGLKTALSMPSIVDASFVYPIQELSVKELFSLIHSAQYHASPTSCSMLHAAQRHSVLGKNSSKTIEVVIDESKSSIAVPIYASLQEVASLFKLNVDQHRAFVIVGKALLHAFADDERSVPADEYLLLRASHQAILLLHGLAGSGKSFVIRAWIALAESWNKPYAVRTCAMTG